METLVSAPFIDCPYCGEKYFGVCGIYKNRYYRRCQKCCRPFGDERSRETKLPEVKKNILYLDQFVISKMMHALNSASSKHEHLEKEKGKQFWIDVFSKIHKICNLQLITCPHSNFHIEESLLTVFDSKEEYEDLSNMYRLLGGGISFKDSKYIQALQIHDSFEKFLDGNNEVGDFYPALILNEDPHKWNDHLFVDVDMYENNLEFAKNVANEIRIRRKNLHSELLRVTDLWRSQNNRKFNDWVEEETNTNKYTILNSFDLKITIEILLRKKGIVASNDMTQKFEEFTDSNYFKNIPYIYISSRMYAAQAQQIAKNHQSKQLPDEGFFDDVELISCFIPYCKAIFIDNRSHTLLVESKLCTPLQQESVSIYGSKVFSTNNIDSFQEYLLTLENNMSEKHFQTIKELYGDDWGKPYVSLYDSKNNIDKKLEVD